MSNAALRHQTELFKREITTSMKTKLASKKKS